MRLFQLLAFQPPVDGAAAADFERFYRVDKPPHGPLLTIELPA